MHSTWIRRAIAVRSLAVGVVVLSGTIASAQVNLALNKAATGSTACNTNEGPAKAVNGTATGGNTDKFCSSVAAAWLQVDLGALHMIGSVTVRHAAAGGENAAWNTRDFNIQISTNGSSWTTPVTVAGNTANVTTHTVAPQSARYVRLNITVATQTGTSPARIYELEVYAPGNLALNKAATGSTSCNANEGPAKAVNGSVTGGNTDKWCGNATPMWLQVDLGAAFNVTAFTVRHAGAGGEAASRNTRDFTIQTSTDNATWTTVVTVTGNTANVSTHAITARTARYVKLSITMAEQAAVGHARVYELEVYGTSGGTPTATPTRTATATSVATLTPTATSTVELITDPARYVDPFIGTSRGGNTWPGATMPFGMIAWSPTSTTGDQTSTGAANGYEYGVTRVRGFSLTHVNGAGCNPGAAGDVPILPFVGDVNSSPTADTADARYAVNFSHANETARPGRYTVTLANGVRTDLAVTTRAGIADFAFPAGSAANLLFRVSNSLNGSEDAEVTIDATARTVTGSVLTGAFCGRRANGGTNNRRSYYRLYFAAVFDHAVTSTGTWKDGTLTPGGTRATGGEGYATGTARAGRGSGGWVRFDTSSDRDVRMRIGISYVSLANAVANRDGEIPATASPDTIAAQTYNAWNTELMRVRVGGGTEARRTAFYTALYHALMQPQTVSDLDGRYSGSNMGIYGIGAGQGRQYGTFSGWDQYRAQIQMLALVRPDVAGDFAQSLYNFAMQDRNIWDRWLHLGSATHVMTGDPAAPTLATFYAMGVRNFDTTGALSSLVRQATVQNVDALNTGGCPGQCTGQRPALDTYLAKKYAPNDACHCWGGAAETLENSLADFSLAQWLQRLGRSEYASFYNRSVYWRNSFNPAATSTEGYMQARLLSGAWQSGFTPSTDVGFAQGSSATYTWMVPQDVSGLARKMGGTAAAIARLDRFFHDDAGNWAVGGGSALRYDPTNEPGIHAPWLYNGLGQPWKTQATVRQIVDTVYTTGPSGLPGNDDLGTMSAWYLFAAMGLYPQVPGRAEMLLGSPIFPRLEIVRSNGVQMSITADNTSTYVQGVTVNGVAHPRSWLDESFVTQGGTVAFRLGTTANTTWATAAADRPVDRVPVE